MPVTDDDIYDRMAQYATELAALLRARAGKQRILAGDGSRHGLNHLMELWQMLPDGPSGEFKIRE